MKKIWILGLAIGMLSAVSVAQVVQAAPPGDGGDKNCIGWCQSMYDFPPGFGGEFARWHTHTDGISCGMTDSIRDANPPQP